jgi:DNA-binding transcriptional LysR family regulator
MQIEVACDAARNTERPHKPGFGLGFLPGQEVIWLSEALRILREEASDVDVTISTKSSPELANALMQGEIDMALLIEADLRCRNSIWRNVAGSLHRRLHIVANLCAKFADSFGSRSAFAR